MTIYIRDLFTDVDNTLLTAHNFSVGSGTWVRRSDGGGNAPGVDAFKIIGNEALVSAVGVDSANGIYTNGVVPGSADYYVEATYLFNVVPSFYALQVGARGTGVLTYGGGANNWVFGYLDNNTTSQIGQWADGVTYTSSGGAATFTTGLHKLRLEVEGTTARLYYDDVLHLTSTHVLSLVGAGALLGATNLFFDDYDMASPTDVVLTKFEVGSLPYGGPPPAFWTDFVNTRELIA